MHDTKHRFKEEQSDEIKELFTSHPWQWFFSGRTDSAKNLNHFQIEEAFKRWRSIACKSTGLQVAAVGATINHHGRHCHALLLGQNRKSETLGDVGPETITQLEKLWHCLAGGSCRILPCESGAASYIVHHNLVGRDAEVMAPLGKSLLNKSKTIH